MGAPSVRRRERLAAATPGFKTNSRPRFRQFVSVIYRVASALGVAALMSACGSSSTPSGPTPVAAAPAPPTYPSLIGGWDGTVTFNASTASTAATCRITWVITSQNLGNFLGTFQTSPGTGACNQSGTVEGVVTPTGAITDIVHGAVINPNGCTRTRREAMVGVLSGAALTAQTSEQLVCSGVALTRSYSIAITKR